MKSINRAFVLMVFLCHAVWAQQTIKSIVVEGNQRIRDDAIEQNLRSKAGEILRRSDIQEDIKRIFRMGYFENVEVYFNENTQTLEIFVVEKKFIRSLKFEGNKEKDSEDLLKEIQVKPFTYLNRDQIEEDIVKLKVLYESKGYYLVDIEPVIQEVNTGEVDIVYKIQENKKVKVTRINFVGNSIFTESELKKVLFTKEKSFLSFLSGSGNFQIEILEQDRQMLWDFYRQHGYFRSVVNPASVTLSPDRRNIAIVFNLEEGEQYRFGKIDIDGELIKEREELEKLIESKEGEIANSTKLQKDVQSLTNVYADEGYAYANIVPQDHFDDEKKVVGWTFLIQPGQKVNIGKIKISGNTSTRDKVIRREMRIVEGEQYSWQKIRQSRENLERLAIFEEVRITTPKGVRDDVIDIEINVKEKQTGTVSLGAGFSTLDSFQIIGKIEKRNVFGYGVDLTFDAQVGARTQVFNLQYRDEYFLDTKWGLTLNAFNIDRRYTSFDLTTRGVSAEVSYPLYTRGLERWRLGVAYSIVDKILGDLQPTVENLFRGGLISSVTTSLSRDTRNRVFEPSKGSLLRISEEVAGGPFAGDHGFSKLEFDGRWFFPAGQNLTIPVIKDSVFAFHLQSGYVAPLDSDDRVPLFERYFPGGILNLRGFPLRSLGPKIKIASSTDPGNFTTSDFVIGGNKQIVFNAEYIFPIIKAVNIKGVVFFDMGNAFDNGETMFTLAGQRQSVGFGIRWFSPIGPLRFEWGYPLDRKEDEKFSVFDFTIGSIF